MKSKIIYTKTDEAPLLATYSLYPILKSFLSKLDIEIELKDISLSARIISVFPEFLKDNQKIDNHLEELGKMVLDPEANIIKLPNISASVPQLNAAINELQSKGYNIPSYNEDPLNKDEKDILERYNKVKGSAVNPVLREGNSDRRAPQSVKNYVKENPHSMGEWSFDSKTHVATMSEGDFHHNEKSVNINSEKLVKIVHTDTKGKSTVLKGDIRLLENEIIDTTFMSKKSLISFFKKEMNDAKENNLLLSLHMKATMMKVSDPIIFGHAVRTYFIDLIDKYDNLFSELNVDFNNGFGDISQKIKNLPQTKLDEINEEISNILAKNADLSMVDSDNGITNLHVPSDVIIDASMPAMIRNSGKLWDKNGKIKDTKAIIPDSSYSAVYSATIDFCKKNGAFNPTTMGTVPNVGLMAQKAEEYGSHDKTFEITSTGTVKVIDESGFVIVDHEVEEGDIWRMCQTKDEPIKDWIKLAVNRAKSTNWPAVFWLNDKRAHDLELIKKINIYLKDYDTSNLDIRILSPHEATIFTLDRLKRGLNTISVTGNVLRDYLTDLFPILELGTSAKMLSIVPLMNGGGLFETGAGGSAPKHVQQFVKEGHLRWDSVGEFMALVVSLEHLAEKNNCSQTRIMAECLDLAIEKLLKSNKSPKRKVGELDNRGSHFYLALYWAKELAKKDLNPKSKNNFKILGETLEKNEKLIISEIDESQGLFKEIDGYYMPCEVAVSKAMRPSKIFNEIIDNF
mgnify:FL=1